jgi:uncharacterized membrane protein YcaP (DUF421 family)
VDLARIAIRAIVSYLFLLGLLRLSGKRAIRHSSPFDFVLALVIGDLIDNALWGEAPMLQFVVASSTLVGLQRIMSTLKQRARSRAR